MIEPSKIVGYLLNPDHPQGRAKAAFFSAFGFEVSDPVALAMAIDRHGASRPIVRTVETIFGIKHEVRCNLECPDRRSPCIVSVWIQPVGDTIHRFVTAYPAE